MTPVIDIAVRSSLVLLLALATARVLRRQSAAHRHLVLAAGVATALAVAPLVSVGAGWTWSVPGQTRPVPLESAADGRVAAGEPGDSVPAPSRDWLLVAWLGGAMMAGGRLMWRAARLRSLTSAWTRLPRRCHSDDRSAARRGRARHH